MSENPPVPTLEVAFSAEVALGKLEDHGVTRAGHRRVVPVIGGRITNGLEAEILSGGADWQTVRSDGSIEVDGRYSARTKRGEYLLLTVRGIRSGRPDVLAALLNGASVDPASYYFRTAITIETSAPALAFLERALFIASCVRTADSVRYTAYRVS